MMVKAVLISIQPQWCEKIANGEKTVEVRKTKPKLNAPFKCYIYCTKAKQYFFHGGIGETLDDLFRTPAGKIKFGYSGELMCCNEPYSADNFLNGKVIGEFVCNHIDKIYTPFGNKTEGTCLSAREMYDYVGSDFCYGWHISDLVIYDKPMVVNNFYKPDKCPYNKEDGCAYPYHCFRAGKLQRCGETLERAPQSWCYVEELLTAQKHETSETPN